MKKWVCILVVIFAMFSTTRLGAQGEKETIFLENGIQKFYKSMPIKSTDCPLFKNWSDQEIKNFLEVVNIMFADIHATRRMINRYGTNQEANPIAKSLLNAGYSIETIGVVGMMVIYFAQNKLPKGTRSIVSWTQAILHFNALSTHEPLGTAPNTRGNEYKITLTITF